MTVRNSKHLNARRRAGRQGGLARISLHGNPGTQVGRAKGGKNSMVTHRALKTRFKLLRKVTTPGKTAAFAEFIGIVIGDGHVDRYQVSISTNSETDLAHAEYIQKLAQKLFDIPVTIITRTSSLAVVVLISSKAVCDLLALHGIPQGSKQRLGVTFPTWITTNPILTTSCVKGLFDTDGCVFEDKHQIRGKSYKSVGIAFANNEPNVLAFFFNALVSLGLHPTQTSRHRVFLRRSRDIEAYFRLVGTSNPKHDARFQAFRKSEKIRRGA